MVEKMGGVGSTRWGDYIKKTTVDECLRLDILSFTRKGYFGNDGIKGTIEWESSNSIRFEINNANPSQRFIQVAYTVSGEYITDHKVHQTIQVETTHLINGGSMFWFKCPGSEQTSCNRRSRILYLPIYFDAPNPRFACRLCNDLTYESCQTATFWTSSWAAKFASLLSERNTQKSDGWEMW